MQAVVVQVEMSPEAARLALGITEAFHADIAQRLTGIVPEHTKKALEKQLADAAEAMSVLERGVSNPVEVEVPDPAEA